MELLSIGYYILIVLFMFMYIACFILNLIRAIKVNKSMKVSYETVKGKVLEIINEKKRVYVKVEYMSPTNHINFVDFFEFTEKEFGDQYYVDQEVEIYYPNVSNFKRVTCFPTYLQGEKIKVKMGPVVTDLILAIVGVLMTGWFTSLIIQLGGFYIFNQGNTSSENIADCGSFSSALIYMLPLFMFISTIPYVIERLTTASKEENQTYLKLSGAKCMAEVKTYKFGRNKDAKGNKESMLQIEFYDNKGNLVQANLNSFMYTETQEQYINILYDLKNPKNVVYLLK
jgi:hypothetical protein